MKQTPAATPKTDSASAKTEPPTQPSGRGGAVWRALHELGTEASERQAKLTEYSTGRSSFVADLLPEQAVQLSAEQTLATLRARYGDAVDLALAPDGTSPAAVSARLRSPVAEQQDARWLRRANIIGINIRTIGSFWNVVKYALTLPQVYDAIHLLPVWEPGVVQSLYGITSWEINREFFSAELAEAAPQLHSPERQLRAVVDLLHLMGKSVGMEVIPHTDRFSQVALAFPSYFEWIRREDDRIAEHGAELHRQVEQRIIEFVLRAGPAVDQPSVSDKRSVEHLFDDETSEKERLLILFGEVQDYQGREARRVALVKHLHHEGYEPLPATMGPPYRGLRVDRRPEALTVDANGLTWRDFEFLQPESMSRVFNPLARYKFYERRDDNANWEIDFEAPRPQVWRYVCEKYGSVQQRFGFDFMRGDMSHVQMRPDGVPAQPDAHYDILAAVKQHVRDACGVPYFGYFAEGFLAPRDVMAYGDEIDHLEASDADVTLGDLQSIAVDNPEWLQSFRRYLDVSHTRRFTAAFTTITSDKDDPRFDGFYLTGNHLRAFIAAFLTDTASYTSLGGEVRDIHHAPAPNEHYTKLFVFHENSGPKATTGPYVWGQNGELFVQNNALRRYADAIWPQIAAREVEWLVYPDATAQSRLIAWAQSAGSSEEDHSLFVVNADTRHPLRGIHIPLPASWTSPPELTCEFALAELGEPSPSVGQNVRPGPISYYLPQLAAGECRVYRATRRAL